MECTECGIVFMDGSADHAEECPKCGGRLRPMDAEEFVGAFNQAQTYLADAAKGVFA